MTIGDRIRKKRLKLGYSQEEVAIKLGYKSRSSVNKMESSRSLPLTKVERMAEVLECSPAYLMGWEDTLSPESAIFDADMLSDRHYKQLYQYWKTLSDTGRTKLMDNAKDLSQIYKKEDEE